MTNSNLPSDDTVTSSSTPSPAITSPAASGEKAKNTSTNATKNSANKRPTSFIGVVFGLVVITTISGLAYFGWLQNQQVAAIDTVVANQQSQLTQLATDAAAAQKNFNAALAAQAQQIADSEEKTRIAQQELSGLREHVFGLTATTTDDWKLAEAHYLARLAGQRLLMERDGEAALALLQAADEIVKNRTDPALYKVREQFSDDIAALKLAGDIDKEGMFLSLSSIGKVVSVLPKPIPENFQIGSTSKVTNSAQNENTIDPSQLSVWERIRYSFNRAFGSLKGHIRVTQTNETIDSLLSTEAQAFLKTSLRLNIEGAQWALLREQPEVYRESLNRVIELLQRYYPLSPEAEKLSEQLQKMREQNIVQPLPDISGSQLILSNYLERLHKVQQSSPAVEKQK